MCVCVCESDAKLNRHETSDFHGLLIDVSSSRTDCAILVDEIVHRLVIALARLYQVN